MRLDQVAAALFADYSRARLQKWIRSGDLTIDGRGAKATLPQKSRTAGRAP